MQHSPPLDNGGIDLPKNGTRGGDTKSSLKLGRMPKREDGWKLLKGKKLLCEKYIKKYKKTKKNINNINIFTILSPIM